MKKLFSSTVARISILLFATIILLGGVFFNKQFFSNKTEEYTCNDPSISAAQIAGFRGISPETLERLQEQSGLKMSEICAMPQAELNEVIERVSEPEGEDEDKDGPKPDSPGEALDFRKLQLQDENGKIPADGLIKAAAKIKTMKANQDINATAAGITSGSWTWLGPGNIGGRIRAIVIHPTNTNTIWAGSVSGGIWKTTDGGLSWYPLDDFMSNMAVASLLIDTSNPNILYAGTGEGFYNSDGIQGAGVFKTTDGGTTWVQLSATNTPDWYYVNRLVMSPTGGIILAATNSGIWRSTDGGNTWNQQSVERVLDVNFSPTDNNKAVASSNYGKVWYSTNGGVSWNAASGLPALDWLGRIEVAYAPSNLNIVYASSSNNGGEIWKSTNGGATYSLVKTGVAGQSWYANIIWVDPKNASNLVVGGLDLWRSLDGGVTFTQISQWGSAPASAHADHHMIIQDPGFNGTTNKRVYFGNDGGVYRTDNIYTVAMLTGWTELNNNLGITQFYGAAGNPTTGEIIGGTQDNGTLFYTPAGGTQGWTTPFGGDGGWSAADPTDPNYFYGEYINLKIHRSANRGISSSYIYTGISDAGSCANFIAPFILDPNNANTMLAGGCSLWRSTNVKAATPSWAAIKATGSPISAIAVAPGNSSIIWTGNNDGDVYKTTNGTVASPTWTQVDNNTPSLPNRYVHRITIDPNDSNVVYVTFGGFSSDNIWLTTDGGTTWADITGSGLTGLPDLPVRSLVIHPNNSNWLYAGTELGIFTSENRGLDWSLPQDGPTNTSVDELFWMNTTLVAATHGRGLYKAPTEMNASNDDFDTATTISYLPYTATQAADAATATGDDPVFQCVSGQRYNTVWYQYTPTASTNITFDTYGSNYDTVLTVWTGSRGALTSVICSDDYDYNINAQSKVAFVATAGTTYYIEVASYDDGGGSLTLNATLANDDFNTPQLISSVPYTDMVDVSGATNAVDDPAVPDCNLAPGFASVWYQYTPSASKSLLLDTFGSDYDTYIAVWTGARGGLSPIGCNDDEIGGSTTQSKLQVNLNASTTYFIEIAQYNDVLGSASPQNQPTPKPTSKPASDVNALSGGMLSFHVSNAGYVISGNAGIAGATLSYTDGTAKTVTANSSGNYSFTVPVNWSGTVTPSLTGYRFTPANRTYTNVLSNQTAQNYSLLVAFVSIGLHDGAILETSETSNFGGDINSTGVLYLGDGAAKKQFRSIVSFNTASLPDTAVISAITLKFTQQSIVGGGNPVTMFQGFMADVITGYFGTFPALQATDFQLASSATYGPFSPVPVSGVYYINLIAAKPNINKLATNNGLTQIRLRFKLDDNNDAIANYLALYSGDTVTTTDRPQLVVTYTVP